VVGLAWVWAKGDLEWVKTLSPLARRQDAPQRRAA
jgi:hypothetical protein